LQVVSAWCFRGRALSASLAAPCTTSGIAVDTWTPPPRPRLGMAHSRPLFSRRDSRHAKDRRRVIGFGIGGTTAMRNKCSSHVHSSFFSSCSKLNAFITERSRAWARVKRFCSTSKETTSRCVMSIIRTLALQWNLVQALSRVLKWSRREQTYFRLPERVMLPRHMT
jgi:hypothetical protein